MPSLARILIVTLLTAALCHVDWTHAATARLRLGVSSLWAPELTSDEKAQVINALGNQLRRSSRLRIVEDRRVKAALKGTPERDEKRELDIQEARDALSKGKQAYFDLQLKTAIKQLKIAKKKYLSNIHLLSDNKDLVESHLYLGMAYVASKKERSGVREFKRVAYLDADRDLSSRKFPPDVIKAFEKAKQSVQKAGRAAIIFDSNPPGATLYVNGKKRGKTPRNMTLAAGEYFFRLRKKGRKDWYGLINLEKGSKRIRRDLKPLIDDAYDTSILQVIREPKQVTPELLEALTELSIELQSDVLMLAEVSRFRGITLSLQLYDTRTQEFSRIEAKTSGANLAALLGKVPAAVKAILGHLNREGYVIPDERISPKAGKSTMLQLAPTPKSKKLKSKGKRVSMRVEPTPWYKKWWVWALVAGAAAGGAAGVVYGTSSDSGVIADNGGNIPGS